MPLGNNRFEIDDSDPEPDLSPMIDCVFILLIFFIVTATFVEEDGFSVNRPEDSANSAQAADDQMLVLIIGKDNRIQHNGRVVTLDAIPGLVQAQLQREERSPIIIQSHKESLHGMTTWVQDAVLKGGAPPTAITLTDS
ncbi:MAG: biopolymer transporter ExbD [Akkermansiaceae bacterium]|jgi:biopolymer transport protein ExbD